MKQEVINYQCDVLEREQTKIQHHIKIHDPHNYRYGTWLLYQTIQHFATNPNYTIKWIGNDPSAHILSFFYCMLVGCLQNQSKSDQLFVKLKYSLYQESKQSLLIPQQKIFIQHLGLVQDSKNIGQFLKKSSYLEKILMKIFQAKCSQMPKRSLKDNQVLKHQKIDQLNWYSTNFPFVTFKILSQKCAEIIISGNMFLIVQQKQCFFVVQNSKRRSVSIYNSVTSSVNKIKAEIYPVTKHTLQIFKTQQKIQSKQDTAQQPKNLSIPISKNVQFKKSLESTPRIPKQRYSISTPIDILRSIQDFQTHVFDQGERNTVDFRLQKQLFASKQAKSDKNSFNNNMTSSPKNQISQLRSTMICDKPNITFGYSTFAKKNNNIIQEKEKIKSISKYQQQKITQNIQKVIQFRQKNQTNSPISSNLNTGRDDFIYQSLTSKQAIINLRSNKDEQSSNLMRRIPKFLTKRNQQITPITFSNSPIKPNASPKHSHNSSKYLFKKQKAGEQHLSKVLSQKQLVHHPPFTQVIVQKKQRVTLTKELLNFYPNGLKKRE